MARSRRPQRKSSIINRRPPIPVPPHTGYQLPTTVVSRHQWHEGHELERELISYSCNTVEFVVSKPFYHRDLRVLTTTVNRGGRGGIQRKPIRPPRARRPRRPSRRNQLEKALASLRLVLCHPAGIYSFSVTSVISAVKKRGVLRVLTRRDEGTKENDTQRPFDLCSFTLRRLSGTLRA